MRETSSQGRSVAFMYNCCGPVMAWPGFAWLICEVTMTTTTCASNCAEKFPRPPGIFRPKRRWKGGRRSRGGAPKRGEEQKKRRRRRREPSVSAGPGRARGPARAPGEAHVLQPWTLGPLPHQCVADDWPSQAHGRGGQLVAVCGLAPTPRELLGSRASPAKLGWQPSYGRLACPPLPHGPIRAESGSASGVPGRPA